MESVGGRYRQESRKVSVSNELELVEEVNSIPGLLLSVKSTTPGATDKKKWYVINYLVRK